MKRHGLKSFTTPYSHGRSNIEYILQIEKDRFKHFLNPKCLRYEESCGHRVPRLKIYNEIHNTYDKLHMNGFEFTHHDVIGNPEHRDALKRRAERMLKIRGCRLFIFYHHRHCVSTNFDKLLNDLNALRSLYLKRCNAVDIILFCQSIVKDPAENWNIAFRTAYIFLPFIRPRYGVAMIRMFFGPGLMMIWLRKCLIW